MNGREHKQFVFRVLPLRRGTVLAGYSDLAQTVPITVLVLDLQAKAPAWLVALVAHDDGFLAGAVHRLFRLQLYNGHLEGAAQIQKTAHKMDLKAVVIPDHQHRTPFWCPVRIQDTSGAILVNQGSSVLV